VGGVRFPTEPRFEAEVVERTEAEDAMGRTPLVVRTTGFRFGVAGRGDAAVGGVVIISAGIGARFAEEEVDEAVRDLSKIILERLMRWQSTGFGGRRQQREGRRRRRR
jgi:hypothetical protein